METNITNLPCVERNTICYILTNLEYPVRRNERHSCSALTCHDDGGIVRASNRDKREQWQLLAVNSSSSSANLVRIQNSQTKLFLVCDSNGVVTGKQKDSQFETASDLWKLEHDSTSGSARFRSLKLGRCLWCGTNLGPRVLSTEENEQSPGTLWKLDFITGELCCIQNGKTYMNLICDPFSRVKLTRGSSYLDDWKVWRFSECGDSGYFRISSWTHTNHFLACDHGRVCVTGDRWSKGTLWSVGDAKSWCGVSIRCICCNRVLRSYGNGTRLSLSYILDDQLARWSLGAAHQNHYYVSSVPERSYLSTRCHATHLLRSKSIQNQLEMHDTRTNGSVWQLRDLCNGFVALLSVNSGKYFQFDEHGPGFQEANRELELASKWKIEISPSGGVYLLSADRPGLALSLAPTGELTLGLPGYASLWKLEPRLPKPHPKWKYLLIMGGMGGVFPLLLPPYPAGAIEVAKEEKAVVASLAFTGSACAALLLPPYAAAIGVAREEKAVMARLAITGSACAALLVACSGDHLVSAGTSLQTANSRRPLCAWRAWSNRGYW